MAGIIAIVFVMLVINSFMVYAIVRCWERVDDKIKKYFLDKSSDFYVSTQTKQNEDYVVEKDTSTVVVKEKPVYLVSAETDNPTYKKDFKEEYKTIKQNMSFDKDEVLNKIVDDNTLNTTSNNTAIELCKIFDFDTIYELSTLDSTNQKKVLRESLKDDQLLFFNEYLSNKKDEFSIIDFFDYIRQIAKNEDPNFYVKTGWKQDNFDDEDKKIVTIHDEDITEGIKVVHKDKLYDYSL